MSVRSGGMEEIGESGEEEWVTVDPVILGDLDPAGSPESGGFNLESSESANYTTTAEPEPTTDWDADDDPVVATPDTGHIPTSEDTDDIDIVEPPETGFTTDDLGVEEEIESLPFEEIVPLTDDSLFGSHYTPNQDPDGIINIADLIITSEEEAREIALFILDELECDVFAYFDGWGEEMPGTEETESELEKPKIWEIDSGLSIASDYSLPLVGDPSTLKLSYEKGDAEPFRTTSIPRITMDGKIDQACEANFHRNAKKFGRFAPVFSEDFTQTKELSFVNHFQAEQIYRSLYPLKDDYTPPRVPSRKSSLDKVLDEADNEKGDGDKGIVGAKVRWSKKTRLLPPLPQNYAKGETFWTGSIFRGEYVSRQFNHGNYNYPLMSTYESEFKEGHAHSKKHLGLVVYPRGDSFEGQWRKGRFMSGNITFGDDLKFEPQNWTYCTPPDRRFYIEKDVGVKQAGRTLYNDRLPPPELRPGCYDTGDGTYDPQTGAVTGYNGQKLREASLQECQWILANCRKAKTVEERYIPSFSVDRLPCSYADKYVKQ